MTQVTLPQKLNSEQAAAALHCHRMSLYRLVKKGLLSAPMRCGGKKSLWDAQEIADLLQKGVMQ